MSETYRQYATSTMEAVCKGAMNSFGDVAITETYMAPGQEAEGAGVVTFDFEGRHHDGTKVFGEVAFSMFDIEEVEEDE